MLYGIWLILLGVLAVPSLVLSKRPDAKEALAKLAPYQGWFGAISALWGVWGIIQSVLNLGWLTSFPIFWATLLASSLLLASLGLILGVGVLKTFISNPEAQAKMDGTITKLAPLQGRLGIVAVALGIWMIVVSIVWSVA
ncbi:MAG: hypothetical protein LBE21_05440 [Pseudomonadales bacterium]|jgi:hypothetical protein|nr:hypothetical protein [Pseudomonadales bacterium]